MMSAGHKHFTHWQPELKKITSRTMENSIKHTKSAISPLMKAPCPHRHGGDQTHHHTTEEESIGKHHDLVKY